MSIRPEKKECAFKDSAEPCAIHGNRCRNCHYNQGLQAERDYWEWRVKNLPIEQVIHKWRISDLLSSMRDLSDNKLAKAIRDLLIKGG